MVATAAITSAKAMNMKRSLAWSASPSGRVYGGGVGWGGVVAAAWSAGVGGLITDDDAPTPTCYRVEGLLSVLLSLCDAGQLEHASNHGEGCGSVDSISTPRCERVRGGGAHRQV